MIYDTYHTKPIAMARGLHYSGLTDAMWTPDGQSLVVCSSDGYLSFIMFEEGELGRVYDKTKEVEEPIVSSHDAKDTLDETSGASTMTTTTTPATPAALVSPLADRQRPAVNILQPKKKSNSSNPGSFGGAPVSVAEDNGSPVLVGRDKVVTADENVDKMCPDGDGKACTVNVLQPKKKRKRVELTFVSPGGQ